MKHCLTDFKKSHDIMSVSLKMLKCRESYAVIFVTKISPISKIGDILETNSAACMRNVACIITFKK